MEGTENPTAVSVEKYTSAFSTSSSAFADAVTIALSDELTMAHVCFRFRATNGIDLVVDNAEFSPPSCPASEIDFDNDGIAGDIDNCLEVSNPSQQDSDNDGFGNACDTDLNGDCVANVLDLAIFRANYFGGGDTPADFNGDGIVGVIDLGIFRVLFFGAPGPSAIATCDSDRP